MKFLITHVLALCIFADSAAPVRAENVAIVLSSDAAAYREALEGFREVVRYRIVSVQTLKEDPGGWREELKRLRVAGEPDLIFVVGISALQAVANDIHDIPVVHALGCNPGGRITSSRKNITDIAMNPSASQKYSRVKDQRQSPSKPLSDHASVVTFPSWHSAWAGVLQSGFECLRETLDICAEAFGHAQ